MKRKDKHATVYVLGLGVKRARPGVDALAEYAKRAEEITGYALTLRRAPRRVALALFFGSDGLAMGRSTVAVCPINSRRILLHELAHLKTQEDIGDMYPHVDSSRLYGWDDGARLEENMKLIVGEAVADLQVHSWSEREYLAHERERLEYARGKRLVAVEQMMYAYTNYVLLLRLAARKRRRNPTGWAMRRLAGGFLRCYREAAAENDHLRDKGASRAFERAAADGVDAAIEVFETGDKAAYRRYLERMPHLLNGGA